MSQFQYPNNDNANPGGWVDQGGGGANIYQSVDEVSTNDADYIRSPVAPVNADVTFGLTDIPDPNSGSGHVLRVRCYQNAGSIPQLTITVTLLQGGTTIASFAQALAANSVFADYSYTLSQAEADSITDYAALVITVRANKAGGAALGSPAITVSWVKLELPDPVASVLERKGIGLSTHGGFKTKLDLRTKI